MYRQCPFWTKSRQGQKFRWGCTVETSPYLRKGGALSEELEGGEHPLSRVLEEVMARGPGA